MITCLSSILRDGVIPPALCVQAGLLPNIPCDSAALAHDVACLHLQALPNALTRFHTSSAGLLNLFWGVLTFKKKAEKALQASGIPYVIVRPGGMERPTDAYKRTHNVRLATRDQLFGGQVSRLQVAELIAAAVSNPDVAENKVSLGRSEHVQCGSAHTHTHMLYGTVQHGVQPNEGSETLSLRCTLACVCTKQGSQLLSQVGLVSLLVCQELTSSL